MGRPKWHDGCSQCCLDCAWRNVAWGHASCKCYMDPRRTTGVYSKPCPHHYSAFSASYAKREEPCPLFRPKSSLVARQFGRPESVDCNHHWGRIGTEKLNAVAWCVRCGMIRMVDDTDSLMTSLWRLARAGQTPTEMVPLSAKRRRSPRARKTTEPSCGVVAAGTGGT